jgi:hypothetical protein
MGFVTVAEFKALPLGLQDRLLDKFGDAAIQSYIDTASTQIENYCKRIIAQAEVTDPMFDGRNNVETVLRQYPVAEITKVAWEDDSGQTGEHDHSNFFLYSSGRLRWKANVPGGPFIFGRHYTITYKAGYTTIPGPIKHACGLWVTELMQPTFATPSGKDNSDLVALSSEQIGELLDGYRRKGVA